MTTKKESVSLRNLKAKVAKRNKKVLSESKKKRLQLDKS